MPSFFSKLAQAASDAGNVVARTAANAHEVLTDRELRKDAGGKLVRGIHSGIRDGIQGIGSTAGAVKRNVLQNVGDSLSTGRRGAMGILDRVQAQVQQQRLRRALSQSRDKPIDVQIGFTVFIDVAQEMRSRLWLVLLQEPALAAPFQELGRFPDLGAFDPSLRQGSGGSPTHSASPGQPPQPAANAVGTHGADQQDATVASSAPLVDAEAAAEGAPAEDDAEAPEVPSASDAAAPGAVGAGTEAKRLHESRESDLADISDVCSDEPVHSQEPDVAAGMIRGGEVGGDEAEPLRGAGELRSPPDESWEVVDKADSLQDGSHVGPASFARAKALRQGSPRPADAGRQSSQGAQDEGSEATTSEAGAASHKGRVLNDSQRRRQEQQEALALKLQVAEENVKDAIITAQWPLKERREEGGQFDTLLQVTLGQEDVEDTILRDIHRTFPEHPRFLSGQGQQELFNVLKAYSMVDIEVGYCQGMGFVAGILLMYMPEQLAFQLFCALMDRRGCNLRRLYLDGLRDLKHEMAMFDWLVKRHHPRLARHLQQHCVPSVLYVSQWLLTCFACPFPAYFTAQLVDIMLVENSDRVILQTAMAIMAEVEERLLRLSDFEDIITCLKSDPAQWSDDKLRGILAAAYLSSVSQDELRLASDAVTREAASLSNASADLQRVLSGSEALAASGEGDEGGSEGAQAAEASALPTSAAARSYSQLAELVQSELQQLTWAEASGEGEADGGGGPAAEPLADVLRKSPGKGKGHGRRVSRGGDLGDTSAGHASTAPGESADTTDSARAE